MCCAFILVRTFSIDSLALNVLTLSRNEDRKAPFSKNKHVLPFKTKYTHFKYQYILLAIIVLKGLYLPKRSSLQKCSSSTSTGAPKNNFQKYLDFPTVSPPSKTAPPPQPNRICPRYKKAFTFQKCRKKVNTILKVLTFHECPHNPKRPSFQGLKLKSVLTKIEVQEHTQTEAGQGHNLFTHTHTHTLHRADDVRSGHRVHMRTCMKCAAHSAV